MRGLPPSWALVAVAAFVGVPGAAADHSPAVKWWDGFYVVEGSEAADAVLLDAALACEASPFTDYRGLGAGCFDLTVTDASKFRAWASWAGGGLPALRVVFLGENHQILSSTDAHCQSVPDTPTPPGAIRAVVYVFAGGPWNGCAASAPVMGVLQAQFIE